MPAQKQMEMENEIRLVSAMDENELAYSLAAYAQFHIRGRMNFQEKSYPEIERMIKDKDKLLASTPAIQPVSNKELNRVASGFGYRIDPVYKTVKFHAGLDFSAPQGTPDLCHRRRTGNYRRKQGQRFWQSRGNQSWLWL